MTADVDAAPVSEDDDWTPIAKTVARLKRSQSEVPGSMQHFAVVLHLGEVVTKLHALVLLGILERFEGGAISPLSFELARASSAGTWIGALREVVGRVQPKMLADEDGKAWFAELRAWLSRPRGRPDAEVLDAVLQPLAELAALLNPGAGSGRGELRTPLDLMQSFVEVRNKTTGHHAYGAEFWSSNVGTLTDAALWIRATSPLWKASLVLPITRDGKKYARVLRGTEPSQTIEAVGMTSGGAACVYESTFVTSLGELIHVDAGTNLTFIANGSWRDSDSTAEFLSHSLEATAPAEGSRRRELSAFAIRPATQRSSETEGEDALALDPGVVANNLPPPATSYVHRPSLEEPLRTNLRDTKRRHLINVRGTGGFGKTSLILQLCHELVSNPDECPYDAVVWMSARDIDLMLTGPTPVRRGQESLEDVWRRFGVLFGEGDDANSRELFEMSMRADSILLVLDNFETFDEQQRAYEYLDQLVEPPAKVVITSRHEFSGENAVEVKGMAQEEADQLLIQSARDAGIEPLMTPAIRSKIFDRCQGHPYAMKLVASQVRSEAGLTDLLTRVVRRGELLDALFRRSVADLGDNEEAIFVFLLLGQFAGGLAEPAVRVITDPAAIDLDLAVRELRHRSLIEIGQPDGPGYDMPAMAREFAQQFLAGHILQTEISSAADFLRRWPSLIQGRVVDAAEGIAHDLRSERVPRPERERMLGALRVLTTFDGSVWAIVARAERLMGAPEEIWSESYKRAIEVDPTRTDLLYEWSETSSDSDRQVELKVQAVSTDRGNVALASKVAHFLNSLYARDKDRYPRVRWTALMNRIIDVLETSFLELDGEALSRLAWLYIHAGRSNEARRIVERGLVVDPENESIRKLAEYQRLRF